MSISEAEAEEGKMVFMLKVYTNKRTMQDALAHYQQG